MQQYFQGRLLNSSSVSFSLPFLLPDNPKCGLIGNGGIVRAAMEEMETKGENTK